ncbi:MAG: LamG-like jellyroll fold domain-containing protein, partial [Elusimicrobiota bacterium]
MKKLNVIIQVICTLCCNASFVLSEQPHPIIFIHGRNNPYVENTPIQYWQGIGSKFADNTAMTRIISESYGGYTTGKLDCTSETELSSTSEKRKIYNFTYYNNDCGCIGSPPSATDINSPSVYPFGSNGEIWFSLGVLGGIKEKMKKIESYTDRWREARHAERLAAFIEEVLTATGADQVDIVAHSMGGLVSRAAIKWYNLPDSKVPVFQKVHKLLMLGTPNNGVNKPDFWYDLWKQFTYENSMDGEILEMDAKTIFFDKNTGQTGSYCSILNTGDWAQGVKYATIAGTRKDSGCLLFPQNDDILVNPDMVSLPGAEFNTVAGFSHGTTNEPNPVCGGNTIVKGEDSLTSSTFTTDVIKKWIIDDVVPEFVYYRDNKSVVKNYEVPAGLAGLVNISISGTGSNDTTIVNLNEGYREAGTYSFGWDGKNDDGEYYFKDQSGQLDIYKDYEYSITITTNTLTGGHSTEIIPVAQSQSTFKLAEIPPLLYGVETNSPFNVNKPLEITFRLSEPCFVTVNILDMNNQIIETIADNKWVEKHKDSVVWDIRDNNGAAFPVGDYKYEISVMDACHKYAPNSVTGTVHNNVVPNETGTNLKYSQIYSMELVYAQQFEGSEDHYSVIKVEMRDNIVFPQIYKTKPLVVINPGAYSGGPIASYYFYEIDYQPNGSGWAGCIIKTYVYWVLENKDNSNADKYYWRGGKPEDLRYSYRIYPTDKICDRLEGETPFSDEHYFKSQNFSWSRPKYYEGVPQTEKTETGQLSLDPTMTGYVIGDYFSFYSGPNQLTKNENISFNSNTLTLSVTLEPFQNYDPFQNAYYNKTFYIKASIPITGKMSIPYVPQNTNLTINVHSDTHPSETIWYANNSPVISWNDPPYQGYSYGISQNDNAVLDASINKNVNSVNYKNLSDGIWYFHIKALDWDGNWTSTYHYKIRIDANVPSIPILATPQDDLSTSNSVITFSWSPSTDINSVSYELQVSNNEYLSSPLINETNLSNISFTPTTSLSDGIYYWRVCAKDSIGNKSEWSDIYTFTIDTALPGKPIPLKPIGYFINNGIDTQKFTWTSVTDISGVQYELVVDEDEGFISPELHEENVLETEFLPFVALPAGIYHWRVRAIDAAGNIGEWSDVQTFSSVPLPSAGANTRAVALDAKLNKLYIANNTADPSLYIYDLDPQTGIPTLAYSYSFDVKAECYLSSLVLDPVDSRLYISASGGTQPYNLLLCTLDPVTGLPSQVITNPDDTKTIISHNIYFPSAVESMAMDYVTRKLYVTARDNSGQIPETLFVYDINPDGALSSQPLQKFQLGVMPSSVIVDSVRNKLYVGEGSGEAGAVYVITLDNGNIKTTDGQPVFTRYTVGDFVSSSVLGIVSNRLYVSLKNANGPDVVVCTLDNTGNIISYDNNVAIGTNGNCAESMYLDSIQRKLYVGTNTEPNLYVYTLDSSGLPTQDTPQSYSLGINTVSMAYDPMKNKLYLGNDSTTNNVCVFPTGTGEYKPIADVTTEEVDGTHLSQILLNPTNAQFVYLDGDIQDSGAYDGTKGWYRYSNGKWYDNLGNMFDTLPKVPLTPGDVDKTVKLTLLDGARPGYCNTSIYEEKTIPLATAADKRVPVVSNFVISNPNVPAGENVYLTYTLDRSANIELRIDNIAVATQPGWQRAGYNSHKLLAQPLASGTHNVEITAKNEDGDSNTAQTIAFTILGPDFPAVKNVTANPSVQIGQTVTIAYTLSGTATPLTGSLKIYNPAGTVAQSYTITTSGSQQWTPTVAGVYKYELTFTDASNRVAAPVSGKVIVLPTTYQTTVAQELTVSSPDTVVTAKPLLLANMPELMSGLSACNTEDLYPVSRAYSLTGTIPQGSKGYVSVTYDPEKYSGDSLVICRYNSALTPPWEAVGASSVDKVNHRVVTEITSTSYYCLFSDTRKPVTNSAFAGNKYETPDIKYLSSNATISLGYSDNLENGVESTSYRLGITDWQPYTVPVSASDLFKVAVPSGCVGLWTFDSVNGTTVFDESGYNNNGIISGQGSTPVLETTPRGKGLVFDGADDRVIINDSASLDLTTGVSLELWFKPSLTPPFVYSALVYKLGNNNVPGYNVYYRITSDQGLPDNVALFMLTTPPASYNNSTGVIPGEWNHVVVTWQSREGGDRYKRIYINGRENPLVRQLFNGPIGTNNSPLYIGVDILNGNPYRGVIDDVAVYNRALTAEEIFMRYQNNQGIASILSYHSIDRAGNVEPDNTVNVALDNIAPVTLVKTITGPSFVVDPMENALPPEWQGVEIDTSVLADPTSAYYDIEAGTLTLLGQAAVAGYIFSSNPGHLIPLNIPGKTNHYYVTSETQLEIVSADMPSGANIVNSGLKSFWWKVKDINGTEKQAGTVGGGNNSVNVCLESLDDGEYQLSSAGEDNVGNQEEVAVLDHLYLDNTAPGAWLELCGKTRIIGDTTYVGTTTQFVLSAYDGTIGSGVNTLYYDADAVLQPGILYESSFCLGTAQNPTLETVTGVSGVWHLNEQSGTVAADSTGHGNTGSITSSPQRVIGKYGTAFKFDGKDDCVRIPHNNTWLKFPGVSFTVSAWINPATYTCTGARTDGENAYFVSKSNHFMLELREDGMIEAWLGTKGFAKLTSKTRIPVGRWSHIAMVYDRSTQQFVLYVNGNEENRMAANLNTTQTIYDLTFGAKYAGQNYYNGILDDVMVSSCALTLSELRAQVNGINGLNLTDGMHELKYVATDYLGNKGQEGSKTVILDRKAPVVTITSPVGGEEFTPVNQAITIGYSVSDNYDPAPEVISAYLELLTPDGSTPVVPPVRVDVLGKQAVSILNDIPAGYTDNYWRLVLTAKDWFDSTASTSTGKFRIIKDVQPPRTTASAGMPSITENGVVLITSQTKYVLSSVDDLVNVNDAAGLGVADTKYRIAVPDPVTPGSYTGEWRDYSAGQEIEFVDAQNAALPDGVYRLEYYSTDTVGNKETEQGINIIVDNTPPVVTLTSPLDNTVVNGVTSITAEVVDANTIGKIEYYVNGVLRNTITNPVVQPIASVGCSESYSWATLAEIDGQYSLKTKVYDKLGNTADSAVPIVVVNNNVLDIRNTGISPAEFNPTLGQVTDIYYELTEHCKSVTVSIKGGSIVGELKLVDS